MADRTESAYADEYEFDDIEDTYTHDCSEDTCCCADPEDNVIICGRCGDEGHSYMQCWSCDEYEGDR